MFLIITLRILLVYSNIQANIAIKRISFINKPFFHFRGVYEKFEDVHVLIFQSIAYHTIHVNFGAKKKTY